MWLFHLPQLAITSAILHVAIPSATMAITPAISQCGIPSATMAITSAISQWQHPICTLAITSSIYMWLFICHKGNNISHVKKLAILSDTMAVTTAISESSHPINHIGINICHHNIQVASICHIDVNICQYPTLKNVAIPSATECKTTLAIPLNWHIINGIHFCHSYYKNYKYECNLDILWNRRVF